MTAHPPDFDAPDLIRERHTIVVVDVAESVRLIQQDELGTVDHWRRLVNEVRSQVLPAYGGRMVKSLGDGMLLEFDSERMGVAAALQVQARAAAYNRGRDARSAVLLRAGVHVGDVLVDELDIYGTDVNLAARLCTLAEPGEVVASAAVRDVLVPGLDAEVEDLGDCDLKHVAQPVRAYRVSAPGGRLVESARVRMPPDQADLRPTLAVLPLEARGVDAAHQAIGDAVAEEVIVALSRSPQINVISRLSTAAFKGRAMTADAIAGALMADYVVSGSVTLQGERVRLLIELSDAARGNVVWAEALDDDLHDLLTPDSDLIRGVVARISLAVVHHEMNHADAQPLPTVRSYGLLLAAIAHMHRASPADFERARQMLEHLAERHRRHAVPHAWLAKWHVLRAVQGWAGDGQAESAQALDHVRRACDSEPGHALALAIGGLVHAYMKADLDTAGDYYACALASNPNESLAWLFSATWHSYRGEGHAAEQAAQRALQLSPLDPLRYFYDSLAATAMLAGGHHQRAIELAQRSLRANRNHSSTYRTLAIAQTLAGQGEGAAATVKELLRVEPGLTVKGYLARYPGRAHAHAQIYANALRSAGVPD
jgi:class 3 adenylate cyclase/TolB-like protein